MPLEAAIERHSVVSGMRGRGCKESKSVPRLFTSIPVLWVPAQDNSDKEMVGGRH